MRVCASSPCSCLLKCWSWRRSAHSTASGHCRCILSTPASGLSSSGLCPPSPPYHLLSDPSARTTPGSLQLVSNSGRMLPHDESIQPSSSLLHSHSTNVDFRPLVSDPIPVHEHGLQQHEKARRLHWTLYGWASLSHCGLKLIVSTVQMIILLQFNYSEVRSEFRV